MKSLPSHLLDKILQNPKLKIKNIASVSAVSKEMRKTVNPILKATKSQRILKQKKKDKQFKDQTKLSFEIIKNGKQYMNYFRNQRNLPQANHINVTLNQFINEENIKQILTNRQKKIIKYILLNYLILSEVNYNKFPIPNIHSNMKTIHNMSKKECNARYNSQIEYYTNNIQTQ